VISVVKAGTYRFVDRLCVGWVVVGWQLSGQGDGNQHCSEEYRLRHRRKGTVAVSISSPLAVSQSQSTPANSAEGHRLKPEDQIASEVI